MGTRSAPWKTRATAAADENALSRIYIGIHFRDAVETGTKHGDKIGKRAVDLFLRPVPGARG